MEETTKCQERTPMYYFAMNIMQVPLGLITAWLISRILTLAMAGYVDTVFLYSILTIAAYLASGIYRFILGTIYDKQRLQYLHLYRMNIYEQFLSSPLNTLFESTNGDVLEKLNHDIDKLANKTIVLVPNLYINIITILSYTIYLGIKSPIIIFVLIIISMLQLIPPFVVKKFMQVNYENTRNIEAKITDQIIVGYNGLEIIKLYGLTEWFLDRIKMLHKHYFKIGSLSESTVTAQKSMYQMVNSAITYGSYAVIGILVLLGYTSTNNGVQAISLSAGLFAAINSLFESIPEFALAKVAKERVSSLIKQTTPSSGSIHTSEIELSNVNYFIDGKEIFHNLTTCIDSNKMILIKGENGMGKSTLLRLIIGCIKSDAETINVGGVSPDRIHDREFLHKILYIPQEDAAFTITAKVLFEMAVPDSCEAALHNALDFGLQEAALISTSMKNLSGGERKKVLLSLALAANTPILLLDEPTNHLDEDSKHILKEKIEQRSNGAIIVTHDKTFDKIADQVLWISEEGAHYV